MKREFPATLATLPGFLLAILLALPLTAGDHLARDFGAIPNDVKDDTRALQQAADACQPGDRLVLESGVYDLTSGITLSAKRDFEWVGQGAELVMRGYNRETDQGSYTLLIDAHYWFESGPERQVIVRGNTFRDCNRGETFRAGALVVFAENHGWMKYGTAGSMRGITIEGNTIRDTKASALFVASADGIVIRNHVIENTNRDVSTFPESASYAIYLKDTRSAVVTGNSFRNIRLPFTQIHCSDVTVSPNSP